MSTIRFRGNERLWVLLTTVSLALLVGIVLFSNNAQASLSSEGSVSAPAAQLQEVHYSSGSGGNAQQKVASGKAAGVAVATPTCGPGYSYSTSTATIVPGVDDIGNHCDDCTTFITLPFAFTFFSTSYLTATVSSNGNLQFTTDNDTQYNDCLPSANIQGPAIFPHWDDLRTDSSNIPCTPGPCGIYTSVSGSAPNRIFNIEWRTSYYSDPGNAYFEILLYEGSTGRFDVILGTLDGGAALATIGAQDGAGAFTQFSCNSFVHDNTQIAFTYSNVCVPTSTSTPTSTPCADCTSTPTPTYSTDYRYGTSPASIVPGTDDTGNHGDDVTTAIGLPFPFQLYDQSYTNATVSSNGNLQFVTSENNYFNSCLPYALLGPAIFPHWDDLVTDDTGTCTPGPCGIYTSVSGNAPNRVFNIEWRASLFPDYVSVNFEIRLYESSPSQFDVILGAIGGSGVSATIGVQDGAGAFTQFECNTSGGAPNNTRIAYICDRCVPPQPTNTPTNTPINGPTNTPTVRPTVPACDVNFADVASDNNAFTAVRYLYCANAISGYTCGGKDEPCPGQYFRPNNDTTRAQLSKIIVLALGWQINTAGGPHFQDVPSDNVFYNFVETAVNHGIISGYDCGAKDEPCPGQYFRPGNNVTRLQLSKIIVLAMQWAITSPSEPHFKDVPTDNAFYGIIETAVSHGIIFGYDCGARGEACPGQYFRPGNNATRSQISLITYRALTNNP